MSKISLLLFLSDTSLKDQVYCTNLLNQIIVITIDTELRAGIFTKALFSGSDSRFSRGVFVHKSFINTRKKYY